MSPSFPALAPSVSLLLPCKNSADFLQETVDQIHSSLRKYFQSFEIIIIANPYSTSDVDAAAAHPDQTLWTALQISKRLPSVKVVTHEAPLGKAAALKTGLANASGEWIFFTDADLPFHLEFFQRAGAELQSGVDFVLGNRRHRQSVIILSNSLLAKFFMRDILGRLFNLAVRMCFPAVRLRDTQAGIKAMTREFADMAFHAETCPGFFGDVEMILVAVRNSRKYKDLPVTFELQDNRSSVRFFQEAFRAIYWLFRIWRQDRKDQYFIAAGEELVEVTPPMKRSSSGI